jgi:hypothetical protein
VPGHAHLVAQFGLVELVAGVAVEDLENAGRVGDAQEFQVPSQHTIRCLTVPPSTSGRAAGRAVDVAECECSVDRQAVMPPVQPLGHLLRGGGVRPL